MRQIFFLFLVLPLRISAQEPDSSSALYGMREAEWNFAHQSVTYGRNYAFINNLAEGSVIFTDRWISSGLLFWKKRPASASVLKWEPEYMDIAQSGDFGISTGPWELQEFRPNTAPLATGYFLTVWAKDNSGTWKAILDAGSTTPPPSGMLHDLQFPSAAGKPFVSFAGDLSAQAASELSGMETTFLEKWISNPETATYLSFMSEDARMQPDGHLPSADADTLGKWISATGKSIRWNTTGFRAARSGDLGYTYGYFEDARKPGKITGHYVRIWKRQPDGRWKIIIEMRNFI